MSCPSSSSPPFAHAQQVKFHRNRIATFSRLFFLPSFTCRCSHSCNNIISLPRKRRNINIVHLLYANSSSSSSSSHQLPLLRNLYSSHRQNSASSFIAFDHSNNNNSSESKEGDQCPLSPCKFLSFFQDLLAHKQVWGFFSYMIRVFGNSIEIVVKQTLHDGLNIGIQWKIESEKIHVPLGKGFSFYISHSYRGKAMLRHTENVLGPLLQLLPFRLKIMAGLAEIKESICCFMMSESEKTRKFWCCGVSLLAMAVLLFFFRFLSFKIVLKFYNRP